MRSRSDQVYVWDHGDGDYLVECRVVYPGTLDGRIVCDGLVRAVPIDSVGGGMNVINTI